MVGLFVVKLKTYCTLRGGTPPRTNMSRTYQFGIDIDNLEVIFGFGNAIDFRVLAHGMPQPLPTGQIKTNAACTHKQA